MMLFYKFSCDALSHKLPRLLVSFSSRDGGFEVSVVRISSLKSITENLMSSILIESDLEQLIFSTFWVDSTDEARLVDSTLYLMKIFVRQKLQILRLQMKKILIILEVYVIMLRKKIYEKASRVIEFYPTNHIRIQTFCVTICYCDIIQQKIF